jgi:hypothetical protein
VFGFIAPVAALFQDEHTELISDGRFDQPLGQEWEISPVVTATIVSIKGPSFKKALHLVVPLMSQTKPNGATVRVITSAMVHLGTTVYIRAWLRTSEPMETSLDLLSGDGRSTSFIAPIQLTTKWKEFKAATAVSGSFLPGELQLVIGLGNQSRTVDIANVRVEDYGDTPPNDLPQTKIVEPRTRPKTS